MGVCCMDYVDIAPLQMSGWWCDFGWRTVTSWSMTMCRMVVFVRACRHDEQGREYLKRARNLHRGGARDVPSTHVEVKASGIYTVT